MLDAELKEKLLELKLQPLIDFLENIEGMDFDAVNVEESLLNVQTALHDNTKSISNLTTVIEDLQKRLKNLEAKW